MILQKWPSVPARRLHHFLRTNARWAYARLLSSN